MRVLVAGATGAVGGPLVRLLQASGHEVIGTTRTPAGAQALTALGVQPVVADVLNRDGLLSSTTGLTADAVIAQLTALKKPPLTFRSMAPTNRLRTEGTRNLLEVAERIGARRFVTQSMMFGYGYRGADRPYTEDDEFGPAGGGKFAPALAAMQANEAAVCGHPTIEGIALRYALFYGVGAGDADLVAAVRKRRLPVLAASGPLSWVYLDDAATAAVAALERGQPGQAYNIADDTPASWTTMVSAVAEAVGAPPPRRLPRRLVTTLLPYAASVMTGGVTIANDQAKRELGWSSAVPGYPEGGRRIAAAAAGRRS